MSLIKEHSTTELKILSLKAVKLAYGSCFQLK